ncbi:hypothetical protein [Streptomyces sp. HUAS TT7]|uniref:hypothetical protein n=1 Tax=Streptomyces sp. HUAS TT7 TaxID=3447507 RepID=UPI003F657CED
MSAKPPPVSAPVPPDDDESADDWTPPVNAPKPQKASDGHPVGRDEDGSKEPRGQGHKATRRQDAKESPEDEQETAHQKPTARSSRRATKTQGDKEPRDQGTNYPSWERPKLGTRVDPWLKQALKIAAAIETRPEEQLVADALISYLYHRHAATVAQVRNAHGIADGQ